MADGTVKQVNPFTGTQVWTIPGRADRPLVPPAERPARRLEPGEELRACVFCPERYLETTPERERVVRRGPEWERLLEVGGAHLFDTVADFRLIPNLYEILSLDYWMANAGYVPSTSARRHQAAYLASPEGREHIHRLDPGGDGLRFFAGSHDVVVSRRHFRDGATWDNESAGSAELTPDEHEQYVALTIRAIRRLYDEHPEACLVAAFQNWQRPAGASFDHLHKQVVAVDEFGTDLQIQLDRLRDQPDLYERWGPAYAEEQGLVIARNAHAVACAGAGHRFPSVEVWSTVPGRPWELPTDAVRGFSDLVHLMHRATGSGVPSNEEWHHQPPAVDSPSPLRVILKWRVNTPAGFEGGTRIYINTIDPWTLRDRVVAALGDLSNR